MQKRDKSWMKDAQGDIKQLAVSLMQMFKKCNRAHLEKGGGVIELDQNGREKTWYVTQVRKNNERGKRKGGDRERERGIDNAAAQWWRGFASAKWNKSLFPRAYQCSIKNKCLGARTDSQQANSAYDVQSHFAQCNERHRRARTWRLRTCLRLCRCGTACARCSAPLRTRLCLHVCAARAPIPRSPNPGERNHMRVKVMVILMYLDRCSVFRVIH